MPSPDAAGLRLPLARYAVAWSYLILFTAAELAYFALPGRDRAAVASWASTSVANLSHDPIGCLAASAFIPAQAGDAAALAYWPVLIALALFGANRALGNGRTLLVCAAGHVAGTLVSEGITGYRVAHGLLPGPADHLIDLGPSYVVVAAIGVALLHGTWPARAAAAADLVILVVPGQIFSGLASLQLTATGHATALAAGVLLGTALAWPRRRRARRLGARQPARETAPLVRRGGRGGSAARRLGGGPAARPAAPPAARSPAGPGTSQGTGS